LQTFPVRKGESNDKFFNNGPKQMELSLKQDDQESILKNIKNLYRTKKCLELQDYKPGKMVIINVLIISKR